jgi:hypothetical protein
VKEWTNVIRDLLTITVPILLFMWRNRSKAKKETAIKHEENQRILNEILTERQYIPAHGHRETSGPLLAENIYRAPKREH